MCPPVLHRMGTIWDAIRTEAELASRSKIANGHSSFRPHCSGAQERDYGLEETKVEMVGARSHCEKQVANASVVVTESKVLKSATSELSVEAAEQYGQPLAEAEVVVMQALLFKKCI